MDSFVVVVPDGPVQMSRLGYEMVPDIIHYPAKYLDLRKYLLSVVVVIFTG